jgi:DNA-binding LacI/PurR family transcriptional regulator
MQQPVFDGPARAAGKVSMKDIARLAGVSQPAVSHVLTGGGRGKIRVSPATAQRIRDIARELRFRPSRAAQQLAGRRSGVLGALAHDWFRPVPLRFLSWLNQLGHARDLKVLATQCDDRPEAVAEYVEEFQAWNLDGLVFVAFENDEQWPTLAPLVARVPAVVAVLGDPGIPGSSVVTSDAAAGVTAAVGHLARRGCRRIVQVLENDRTQMNRRRLAAFGLALAAAGLSHEPWQDCLATEGWEGDYPRYLALGDDLVGTRAADGIIADSDFTAAFLVRALRQRGRRVPDDVAVIGWGNEPLAPWFDPPLTTISYRMDAVVEAALGLLTERIERPGETEPRAVAVEPRLVVRESA